jgi:hypothetical protein
VDQDPDPNWIRIQWTLWIRISHCGPESGSLSKKMKKIKHFIFISEEQEIVAF